VKVAVIGDRIAGFTPQESIAACLPGIDVTWFPTTSIGDATLAGFDGIWCAPGSPYQSLDGALRGIRYARERGVPFIGTCAGFQHGVIEFARDVLHLTTAGHAEYGAGGELIIDELLCSLVGQEMKLSLHGRMAAVYNAPTTVEHYYCRFGLDESYVPRLEDHGLLVGGTDETGTRLLYLADHPFFVLTLFVPQTHPVQPHPLIEAFVQALYARA
jgi:CTP synthase (UTP-ammonia lyase)